MFSKANGLKKMFSIFLYFYSNEDKNVEIPETLSTDANISLEQTPETGKDVPQQLENKVPTGADKPVDTITEPAKTDGDKPKQQVQL